MDVDLVLVIIMGMIIVMGVPIIDLILLPVAVPIMAIRNLQNKSHPGVLGRGRHGAQHAIMAFAPRPSRSQLRAIWLQLDRSSVLESRASASFAPGRAR